MHPVSPRILATMLFWAIPFLTLMLFYVGYLLRMAWYFGRIRPSRSRFGKPSITVIVPARNECKGVEACIRSICAQDYPADKLEIILVNDHSEDDTVALAQKAAAGDRRFRVIHLDVQTGHAYKKAAVACAIAQSKGDWIVTTDADCTMGPGWLSAMSDHFVEDVAMVSGPVMLTGRGVFEEFQALEFMGLIAVGAGGIEAGTPTMCNGANLAYRKDAFEHVGGFEGIDQIASGDDELLMHKMASAGKGIRFSKDKGSIVQTPAQSTWEGFKAQRIRWVSKSRIYRRSSITWTLVLAYLAMAGIPLLAIFAFWEPRLWWVVGGELILKMTAEALVLVQAAAFFDNLRLLVWLPFEQLAHIAYVLWVGIAGNRKAYTWKGRTVK